HELRTFFALTEPDLGSDFAGSLETVADSQGDTCVTNGEKNRIGGANGPDIIQEFAVHTETAKPHCFVVRPEQEGVEIEVIVN
ncbi:glutaryl-CoA dehydrogenase, partial [Staphylococcus aureus]|uniref:acyl-CoA dehydrogenase family protein n=1 Tax=Staphylococcus aureus TaxID=1280 RepID=UPI00065BC013